MTLSISHDTSYRYQDQVRASIQYLRLTPQQSQRQHVFNWQLELPRPVRAQRDPYGNVLHVLTPDEPHDELVIRAQGQVEIDESCECEAEEGSPLPFLRSSPLTQADGAGLGTGFSSGTGRAADHQALSGRPLRVGTGFIRGARSARSVRSRDRSAVLQQGDLRRADAPERALRKHRKRPVGAREKLAAAAGFC